MATLDDLSLLPELARLLKTTSDVEVHGIVARWLGRLSRNTQDRSVADALVGQLLARPRGERAEQILSSLRGSPVPDAQRLAGLLGDGHKKLWWHVMEVLKDSPEARLEDEVLYVFKNTRSMYERMNAARLLGSYRSAKAVPQLEERLFDKKQDVALEALAALGAIRGPEGCPFFLELMDNPKFRYKESVTLQIARHCGAAGVPRMVKRLKAITARPRADISYSSGGTELTVAVAHLEEHGSGERDVAKLYQVLKRRWKQLLPCEREWLVGHVPAFADVHWNVIDEFDGPPPAVPNSVEQARALECLRRGLNLLEFDQKHPAHPLVRVQHRSNNTASEVAAALAHFPGILQLDVAQVALENEHLAVIGAASGLKTLRLADAAAITDAGLRHLWGLRHLEALSLGGASIGEPSVEWIVSLAQLRVLDLPRSHVSQTGCRRLMELVGLEELILEDVDDAGLVGLETLPQLRLLRLYGSGVTSEAIKHLSGSVCLELLDLRDTSVDDEGLQTLVGLPRLRNLYLAGTHVSEAGAERLRAERPEMKVDLQTARG